MIKILSPLKLPSPFLPAATTTQAGLMTAADKLALAAAGTGGGNGGSNLDLTPFILNNSTSTITPDGSNHFTFLLELNTNKTINDIANPVNGALYHFHIKQTANYTLSWGHNYRGTILPINTTANFTDWYTFQCIGTEFRLDSKKGPFAPILVGRGSDKLPITYTVSEFESGYVYYDSNNNYTRINDGIKTQNGGNGGVIKTTGGPISNEMSLLINTGASIWLNEILITGGQFNGNYSAPTRLRIYAGSNFDTLLGDFNLNTTTVNANGLPESLLDLLYLTNFDTPLQNYLFRITGPSQISIMEIELKGHVY